jgi:hypothetical protein
LIDSLQRAGKSVPTAPREGGVRRTLVSIGLAAALGLLLSVRLGFAIEEPKALNPALADTAATFEPPAFPPLDAGAATGKIIRTIRAKGFVNVDSVVIVRTFGLRRRRTHGSGRDGVRRLYQAVSTPTSMSPTRPRGRCSYGGRAGAVGIKGIAFQGAKKGSQR